MRGRRQGELSPRAVEELEGESFEALNPMCASREGKDQSLNGKEHRIIRTRTNKIRCKSYIDLIYPYKVMNDEAKYISRSIVA